MSKSARSLRFSSPDDMPPGMRALYQQQEQADNDRVARLVSTLAEARQELERGIAVPGALLGVPKPTPPKRHPTRRPAGEMNKTEARYAQQLEALQSAGEVLWWRFEPFKFRLAPKTYLTPDFVVLKPGRVIEIVDVKGRKGDRYFAEEDAKVKLKVAAAMFWWMTFVVAWPAKGGGWCREVLPA